MKKWLWGLVVLAGVGVWQHQAVLTAYAEFFTINNPTKGADAIIHMAAIPNPIMAPEHEVFRVKMVSNWNVLGATEIHDIPKLALASSVNAIGAVFSKAPGPGVFSH